MYYTFLGGLGDVGPLNQFMSKLIIVFPFEIIQPYSGCPARFEGGVW
jgi:hypothetical protein